MTLPFIPVTSFEDATLNFEALAALTSLGIDYGVASLTFPGGAASTTLIVNHAFNVAPTLVLTSQQNGIQPGGALVFDRAQTITATGFTIYAQTIDGSNPTAGSTVAIGWLALL